MNCELAALREGMIFQFFVQLTELPASPPLAVL